MKGVFPKFALQQLGPYIAFIVIFVYNVVLGYDLQCSCDKVYISCVLYMILPILILLFLQLWMDKTFQRVCKYTCVCTCGGQAGVEGAGGEQAGVEGAGGGQAGVEGASGGCWDSCKRCCRRCWDYCKRCCTCCCRCTFCLVLWKHLFKAAFISALWVVSVFIDGDWYVCCKNYNSDHQDLACREKEKNITLEERKLIAELKSKSLVIGLGTLCGLVAVALLLVLRCFCKDSDCCKKSGCCKNLGCCKKSDCCKKSGCCKKSDCCNKENFYYELIVEEEEDVLKEILTTAAKENFTKGIKDKLSNDPWTECFDVAEQLIDNETKPRGADSQERNLKLEQLKLEVKRLRAEVQKLEPDTAATGGTSGRTSQERNPELEQLKLEVKELNTEVQKLEPETPAGGGTGGPSGGPSQGEAIELQTVNTEVKRLHAEVQKLEPETPAKGRTGGSSAGASQGEEHDDFTREERNLQLKQLKLEVKRLRAEVQKLKPETAATGRSGGTGGRTGGRTRGGASQNVQHVPSPP